MSHDPLQTMWDALDTAECHPRGQLHNFRARCPGHDGENADALHVSEGDDGRVLLHCFRGCEPVEVIDALRLPFGAMFREDHALYAPSGNGNGKRASRNGSRSVSALNVRELLIDMTTVADEPPDYLIDPLAARGYLTLMPGKRGSFKSFLTLVLAHRCHRGGGTLAGIRCAHVRSLIVDAENGARLMRRRFSIAGINPKTGPLVADGTKLHLPGHTKLLGALIQHARAELVVLDSLRRLTPGLDEDSSRDMAPVLADLANLARELNVAIVLLHHQSSKPGAPPSRGSSAIEDQADVVMRLTRYKHRRLKLWVGADGKFRIDEEPAPLWLTFGWDGGRFSLGTTEAAPDDEADEDPGPSPRELLGDTLLAWAHERLATCQPLGNPGNWQVANTSWTASEMARGVNRDPADGSVRRALDDLEIKGQIERGEGKRWRPTPALLDAVFEAAEGES